MNAIAQQAVKVLRAHKAAGYPVFYGDYNLNLIGLRSSMRDSNAFNDRLFVFYDLHDRAMMHCFDITTDPGTFYREHPINVDGTAVVAPGHYSKCWEIGKHRGLYDALVQVDDMAVFRDNNADRSLDMKTDTLQVGIFGINLHRANERRQSTVVGKWSAGCQVVADPLDFNIVMALAKKSADIYGPLFSYTLLDEAEL